MRPRGRTGNLPRQPMRQTYENFNPKSEWKSEDDSTILLIHLPGFVKEQIRVMFTYTDNVKLAIKVQGQRPLFGGRWRQFNEIYRIPESCDIDKITSNFERGFLTIVMPKTVEAKKVSANKEENKETPGISSHQEKAETLAVEKQKDEENVETLSPKKVTSTEEKSEKGQEETSSKTAASVDTVEKINEKRAESGGESAHIKTDGKTRESRDEASPKTASLFDSAEKIDEKKAGSGGESAYVKADGKSEMGPDEASLKTAALVDTAEKIDEKRLGWGADQSAYKKADEKSEKGQDEASTKTTTLVNTARKNGEKRVGLGGESDYEKPDGISEKGQDEATTRTATLVNTAEKIDEKKVGSDGHGSVYEKAGENKEKGEAIKKGKTAEAEKPESRAEKSKEFSAALEAVVPKTEKKEKIIDKSEKSVNDLEEERKKDTIFGKSKDTKDESASASEGSTEQKHLLLNMGTAVLVIMGLGAYISYSTVGSFEKPN